MFLLILKSSACLAVFMLFYKLFLEKESVHHFKRFYLLGALLVSMVIPFITFTEYIQVEPVQEFMPFQPLAFTDAVVEKNTTWQDYGPNILWSMYALGVVIFSIRFLKNLFQLFQKIKTNPKFKNQNFINVLLVDLIHPHTFFNYIFLNKNKYEHNLIPNEVLWHEQTHAKQKHAIDILFIEVLHIIFWFNPLLYFIKKDIKLNHEFLADQAVLKQGVCTKNYQQLLLACSSPDNYRDARTHQLANAINYSLIKKRFTVMKTQTSKKVFWLKGLLILPILAMLIYGFSGKEIVEKESTNIIEKQTSKVTANTEIKNQKHYRIITFLDKDGLVLLPNGWYPVSTLKKSFGKFHNKSKADSTEIELLIHKKSSENTALLAIDILNSFGTLNTKYVDKLGWIPNHKKPNIQQKATPKQIAEYNKLAKHMSKQIKNKGSIKLKQVKRLKHLYNLMSNSQKEQAEPYPDLSLVPPPPPPAPKPAKAELVEVPAKSPKAPKAPKPPKTDKTKEVVPPPPPPVMKSSGENNGNHSKELQKAWKAFKTEGDKYGEAVQNYSTNKKGTLSALNKQYKEVMKLYNAYHDIAKKENQNAVPPPPPPMDPFSTYSSLAQRTKYIPVNRENNLQRLRVLYDKISDSKKNKVESPDSIGNYIKQLNSLTAEQTKKVTELLNNINKKAKSEGRKFYSAAEYKMLEDLYASMLSN